MAQCNVSIRMDAELKRDFEEFCSAIGLSMTSAFTIFAKKAVTEYKIPFEVDAERPNKMTRQAMKHVDEGKNLSKEYHSVSAVMEDLYADDTV